MCDGESSAVEPSGKRSRSHARSTESAFFDRLYRDYFDELCARLRHKFGGSSPEPEDVVQSAFLKFASMDRSRDIKNPRAFIYTIARNLVLDHKRNAKVMNNYLNEQTPWDIWRGAGEATQDRELEDRQRLATVLHAMNGLPEKQQCIIMMNRLEGKSFRAMREQTGWSNGDMSRQLNDGISALALALERVDAPPKVATGAARAVA